MKVVITGGAGFIGSHIAEEFAKISEVTIIDIFQQVK
jgi:nucleoside-diphosphate-sugar epimerase